MELPSDSAIRIIEQQDRENYQGVVDFLGYASLIPDDIDRLYAEHTEGISPYLQTPASRSAGGRFLCSDCTPPNAAVRREERLRPPE